MINSFEISQTEDKNYEYNYEFQKDLHINFQHEDIFNVVSKDSRTIACYGYCFDVRSPKMTIEETLNQLIADDNISNDFKYLNGHFILVFNISGEWKLITDAVSITPIYVDFKNKNILTSNENNELSTLNSNVIINLEDFSTNRLELPTNKLSDDRIERIILDAVGNQYKYFMNKDLTLNFRRNKMNKALLSILNPALFGKDLNLRQDDDISLRIGKWISRDYKMNLLDQDAELTTKYISNAHLMDYKLYINNEPSLSKEKLTQFREVNLLNKDRLLSRVVIEHNLLTKLKYRKETKPHLIYDPFNVRVIQDRIYTFSNSKAFDPLGRIIKILQPSIEFYDFVRGITLEQKYKQLKNTYTKLKEESKKSVRNLEFINKASKENIELSTNLDGELLSDGITVFPASINISKDEVFKVKYTKKGQGLVLVETFFNNSKNAHRIKITIDDEVFNVDDFLEGKFLNVDSTLSLKMSYERDYDVASWQKAGMIRIKELD